ncbi:MAG: SDR family oxidoreductase [Thermaerobacter sp.]|nr:NAD(P)-dependent oxidoreductase [Bacillota bacterium]REJ32592.1 MAG: NAD(P)-dependent oxidoreductase [Bacillota bacterium]
MSALQGRTAVVTGASRGIGRAIVRRLAAEGVRMVAVARSRDALEELARELPGTVIPAAADIRDPAAVDGVRDLALDRLGHVDILVNNAGVGHFGLIEELTPEQWDEMFDVNLKGAYLMCRAFVPHMKERRSGHIINIASVAGLVTFPRGAGYCASKWGVIALTETLIQELKPYELKVSAICPGSVQTHFGGTPPRDYSLRPEDVAEMVAVVASQPRGVILNQIVMRPLVPAALQGGQA